jgi:rod shape-determining protein MreD
MIREIYKNIGNFVFIILLQVLILNNIEFSGFINPYLYILFILLLPFETPKWILLLVSFILGLTIDIFSNTLGLHAFATVAIAYIRPYVLKIFAPREGYEAGMRPGLSSFGWEWTLKYFFIIVFIHHFILFFTETFKFQMFFPTLLRVILSTLFTVILIILSQLLTQKR